MQMTYEFVKKLRPSFSLVFIFMPLPGSELYQYYIDQGYRFDYSKIRSDKAAFASAGLSMEELEEIRKEWYRDFNRKPSPMVRGVELLKEMRSWSDFRNVCGKTVRYLRRKAG
jgi:hypothetical protein